MLDVPTHMAVTFGYVFACRHEERRQVHRKDKDAACRQTPSLSWVLWYMELSMLLVSVPLSPAALSELPDSRSLCFQNEQCTDKTDTSPECA